MTIDDGRPGDVVATSELTVAIAQAIAALFSTGTVLSAGAVHETLAEVRAMAVADIEGCDLAAVVVMDEDGLVSTPAYSHGAVAEIGFIQTPRRGAP